MRTLQARLNHAMLLRRSRTILGALALALAAVVFPRAAGAADLSQGFDVVMPPGWTAVNNSSPVGVQPWFQGNPAVFPAHSGADNSYAAANFNSVSGAGTISNC